MGGTSRHRPVSVLKRRVFQILEIASPDDRLSVIINRLIVGSIFINVACVVMETEKGLRDLYWREFRLLEGLTVFVFILEYFLRLWVCTINPHLRRKGSVGARVHYALRPMALIDLVSILPPFLAMLIGIDEIATFSAFRLLRFLKLARHSPGMRSLTAALMSERRAILGCGVIMLGLIIVAGTVMHAVEGAVQPEKFGSIPAAMYWAVTTLTTVGYGDVVPVTALGKIISGLTMLCGFTMFALPVGIIATAFAREIHQQDFVVTWSMVARVPLFSEFSAQEVAEVMKMLRSQTAEAGTLITRKGEAAHSMYFIVAGTVEIDLPQHKVRLTDGDFFGEMAVLKNSRRSANVMAVTPCKLLVLDAADLHFLMHRQPGIAKHIKSEAEARQLADTVTPRGDLALTEIEAGMVVSDDPLPDEDTPH